MSVNHYRVFCETDGKFEYLWSESDPTDCPINSSHTIDTDKTTIIERIKTTKIEIKEESIETGGHFACLTNLITCDANSTAQSITILPMPISALVTIFVSSAANEGDAVSLSINPNKTIGILTATTPGTANAWTSQNYTVGTTVVYSDKLYTCIKDTVANDSPTNIVYWARGYGLSVSPTVAQYAKIGFYLTLDNGNVATDVGRVISINATNNYIYVENNISQVYGFGTVAKLNVYVFRDFIIGPANEYTIGMSKIGGSYIPADTPIVVTYHNNSSSNKTLVGRLEYLY